MAFISLLWSAKNLGENSTLFWLCLKCSYRLLTFWQIKSLNCGKILIKQPNYCFDVPSRYKRAALGSWNYSCHFILMQIIRLHALTKKMFLCCDERIWLMALLFSPTRSGYFAVVARKTAHACVPPRISMSFLIALSSCKHLPLQQSI